MNIVDVGTGTLGSVLIKVLKDNRHEVITVGRKTGDYHADITDIATLKELFAKIGRFDAVANAAGDVSPGPFEELTDGQWAKSIGGKGMGQINVVRAALSHIADKGSFTLISGVLTDEYMHGGTIGTTIKHMVEGFVRPPQSSCHVACASIASARVDGIGRLSRLLHRFFARSSVGGCPRESPSDFDSDYRQHP